MAGMCGAGCSLLCPTGGGGGGGGWGAGLAGGGGAIHIMIMGELFLSGLYCESYVKRFSIFLYYLLHIRQKCTPKTIRNLSS